MPATAIKPDVSSMSSVDALQSVQKLVWKLTHGFHDRYGGEWEDWEAEAQLCFTSAYRTWSPERAKLTTWVYWAVWNGLRDVVRKKYQSEQRLPTNPESVVFGGNEDSGGLANFPDRFHLQFDKESLLEKVSDDASLVIDLVLEPPVDVLLTARQRGGELNPKNLKRAVIEYLKDVGWATERVLESFTEIAEALNG